MGPAPTFPSSYREAWKAKSARFNGEWIFPHIHREIKDSAMAHGGEGIDAVTIMGPMPIVVPKTIAETPPTTSAATPAPTPGRAPEEIVNRPSNPGF